MSEEQNKKPEVQEIDLIELARKIWAKRRLVIKNCIIAAVVGVIIAFSIPKEYETKVTLAPESSGTRGGLGGNLGSLASMAGINLGNMSSEDAISPDLYPDILKSTPFLVDLFNVRVETKNGDLKTTLYDYLDEHQKEAWFGYILSAPFKALGWCVSLFRGKLKKDSSTEFNFFNLSIEQEEIAKSVEGRIMASVDEKTGIISILVRMQDPLISAALADTVKNRLQEHIINYRTSKVREDLIFAERLYKDAEQNYLEAQKKYATYIDGNLDIILQRYKVEEERLKNEVNLAYNVFSQVAQQVQLAKAKVQERTPVYTVIQPAIMKQRAAFPKKILLLIGFVFFGFFSTIGWIVLKNKIDERI